MQNLLTTVGLEITNYCNLNCIHCYEGELKCNKHLCLETIEAVINKVTRFSPQFFVITGGEPFLHPQIKDILIALGKRFASHKFVIATNGTLINEEIVNILRNYENISIQISLDGATERTHNLQHGNSFSRVMNAIDLVTQQLSLDRISLQMTVSKINYRECIDVAEFAKSKGIEVKFQYICMVGNAVKNKDLLYMSALQKTSTYLKLKEYQNNNPDVKANAPKTLLSCSFEDINTPLSLNIDIHGNVVTCTCFDSSFSLISFQYTNAIFTNV